ncbi:MAG: substrate-binding domain-containing protein [Oscillospiraceae bacterium]|nr:substrate-binding domain-containing protein [Oscillospiraceae bacterium]
MKKFTILLFTLILLLSLFSCNNANTSKSISNSSSSLTLTPDNYPKVDGSTATIPLAVALRSYVTGESKDALDLSTVHTKTTESFRGLQYGSCDLLLVYTPNDSVLQELKAANVDIIMQPIGRDALVFFTNESNPVKNLTQKQAQDIYSGNIVNWKDVGGSDSEILPFQRVEDSGSQVMMKGLVMKDIPMMQPKQGFMIAEMGEIIQTVASYDNKENALGYSVYYYIAAFLNKDYKIKLLDANGIKPSNETIKDGSYPYTQDFYAVIKSSEPENSNTRKLFNLITSDEGKKIITDAGYVALDN